MKLYNALFQMSIAVFIFNVIAIVLCLIVGAFGVEVDARLLMVSIMFMLMSLASAFFFIELMDKRNNNY
jgi:hypothetical protein